MPVDGSKARHKSTQQYYRDIQKLSDDLKAEVVDLQQQKETAREELRRAKKETQTATLVKGKPLEYAGELYSEEHGRKFTTERAGFQVLKDPTDGTRLVLAIYRKPIAEWFKEQFEKLRQNIRRPIQPQRKSRGMKL